MSSAGDHAGTTSCLTGATWACGLRSRHQEFESCLVSSAVAALLEESAEVHQRCHWCNVRAAWRRLRFPVAHPVARCRNSGRRGCDCPVTATSERRPLGRPARADAGCASWRPCQSLSERLLWAPMRRCLASVPPGLPGKPAVGLNITIDHDRIVEVWRQDRVGRLSFFGSVLRDDFGPASSGRWRWGCWWCPPTSGR